MTGPEVEDPPDLAGIHARLAGDVADLFDELGAGEITRNQLFDQFGPLVARYSMDVGRLVATSYPYSRRR